MNYRYSGQQICVLVPTRDRPEHVARLLKSLAGQTEPLGRIIIIASGRDIEGTVNHFSDDLPIDYYHTSQAGQIRQRNIGITKLDARTPLVACIDDDIVLDPWAIKEMVHFWNGAPPNTGGVGFNISNGPSNRPTLYNRILWLGDPPPGRVLVSGSSTSISHLQDNIRSQWLNGGTTVWRKDLLVNNKHKEINTKWAIAEDLIFSYPLWKVYPLYVCAAATVSHNHYPYSTKDSQWHFFHGRTQTLWVYHFVKSNRELSKALFLLTIFIRISSKAICGLVARRPDLINFAFGAATAVGEIVKHAFGMSGKQDIREK